MTRSTIFVRIGFLILSTAAAGLLAGCGSVTEVTKDRVARSETAVQQAEQAVGNSENGALELQNAKNNLGHARQALKDKDGKKAEQLAQLAQLDADLAVAKSQSAAAHKAAEELMASIETLRREAGKTNPPNPPPQR